MKKLTLNGSWTLEVSGWGRAVPATVPGSVYHDLLSAGRIPDPFYRDNEEAALKLTFHIWNPRVIFGSLLRLRCSYQDIGSLALVLLIGTAAGCVGLDSPAAV